MIEEINARIEEGRRLLERRRQLNQALLQARECLGQERYKHSQVEAALEQAQTEIDALESLTLQSLLDSVLGRKERRLTEFRDEASDLEQQYEQAEETISSVSQAIASLEDELAKLEDADRVLQTLLDQKQELMLERHDEPAQHLSRLAAELGETEAQRHRLEGTIQTGEHLLERLHTLTNTSGRTRIKMFRPRAIGLVGTIAVNAIVRKGSDSAVGRVREGLKQFGREIRQLSLRDDSELDREILRLAGVVEALPADLKSKWAGLVGCDPSASRPILDHVHAALGHLKHKQDQYTSAIASLDQQRQALIESA